MLETINRYYEMAEEAIRKFISATSPFINLIIFGIFIIFSLITIIGLEADKNFDIRWYNISTTVFIYILSIFIGLPIIPFIIKTIVVFVISIFNIITGKNPNNETAPSDSKQGSYSSPSQNTDSAINTEITNMIIESVKILIILIHTIITFITLIGIYTIVEDNNYFNNFTSTINSILFFVCLFYLLTIVFTIHYPKGQNRILGLAVVIFIINFLCKPLYWIINTAVYYAHQSNNFWVHLCFLIILTILIGVMNYYWIIFGAGPKLLRLTESITDKLEEFVDIISKNIITRTFAKIIDTILRILSSNDDDLDKGNRTKHKKI